MDQQQLKSILELHRKWVLGEGSERANLSGADLRNVDLSNAYLSGANLSNADLSGANLINANLSGVNLSFADLRDADLSGANLRYTNLNNADFRLASIRYANLSFADLRDADLSGANLRYTNLSNAYLSKADLSNADLSGANLINANLSGVNLKNADFRLASIRYANLRGANLNDIIEDFYNVLSVAKNEVVGLYDALIRGKVDGSQYEGDCACLVGTIANIRIENYKKLEIDLRPDENRPSEKWFLGVVKGDTPENSIISKLIVEWMQEWMKKEGIAVPSYKLVSSLDNPELFNKK